MARKIIERLALPGVAAMAVLSAAIAANPAMLETAYTSQATALEAAEAGDHARSIFERADLDMNGVLDAGEFGALALVTAELARLNGFVAIDFAAEPRTVSLDLDGPTALTGAERARIGAVAAREFYLAAGEDGRLDRTEFVAFELEKFSGADRNRNGVLDTDELKVFASRTARLPQSAA